MLSYGIHLAVCSLHLPQASHSRIFFFAKSYPYSLRARGISDPKEKHETMTQQPPISSSSSYMFDKDVEIQSIHSESSHTDAEETERQRVYESLTEKGDIEAYPVAINGPQNGKEHAVTRTSTKSSWKDPGPPPDGGLVGWTQGICCLIPSRTLANNLSCPWTSRHYEYLGFHQFVRRLPNILRDRPQPSTKRYILGWIDAGFPSLLHRNIHRQIDRCWIFPSRIPGWFLSRRLRSIHDLSVHELLAAVPGPRSMLWFGKRMLVLS